MGRRRRAHRVESNVAALRGRSRVPLRARTGLRVPVLIGQGQAGRDLWVDDDCVAELCPETLRMAKRGIARCQ